MSDQIALDVLASHGVTCLLSSHGQVPLSSLENRSICILFSANWCRPCRTFIPHLAQLYETVNAAGEHPLEIIFVSLDRDEDAFNEHFQCMPWLAVPFDVSLHGRLNKHYRVHRIPALIPLTSEELPGHDELIGLVEDYGAEAFPFTTKRLEELKILDVSRREGGNLEHLLAGEGRDCLFLSDGGAGRLSVSHLIGKTIGLYFGASWSPPCSDFTQQLMEAYAELKATTRDQCFEVVFVSTDGNKEEFDVGTSSMPWPFIPYEDKSRRDLCRIFNIRRIPVLIIIGRDGTTVSREGREMVSEYGAMGFPFTEERRREIEEALRKEGEKLGREVKDARHEHVLKLGMAKAYVCDLCKRAGRFWALSCEDCNYDLHPSCLAVVEEGDDGHQQWVGVASGRLRAAVGGGQLKDAGIEIDPPGDFTREVERKLGQLVLEKYDTEFFILHRYPLAVRPFYTMPCYDDPAYSKEIITGAQRIHVPEFLTKRAEAYGIDVKTIETYIDSFRYGAPPHGGFGVGLERVIMLFCGINNIRKTSLFPCDPLRISP